MSLSSTAEKATFPVTMKREHIWIIHVTWSRIKTDEPFKVRKQHNFRPYRRHHLRSEDDTSPKVPLQNERDCNDLGRPVWVIKMSLWTKGMITIAITDSDYYIFARKMVISSHVHDAISLKKSCMRMPFRLETDTWMDGQFIFGLWTSKREYRSIISYIFCSKQSVK